MSLVDRGIWCARQESNPHPIPYEGTALPVELRARPGRPCRSAEPAVYGASGDGGYGFGGLIRVTETTLAQPNRLMNLLAVIFDDPINFVESIARQFLLRGD